MPNSVYLKKIFLLGLLIIGFQIIMESLNFYVSCNLYFNILDLEIVSSNYYIDFLNNIWIYDLNLKAIHSFTL